MSMQVFRRIVEAFFRHWPVYLSLLIASIAFGVYTIGQSERVYTSSGTIFVDNQSLVSAQSGVQSGASFSYLSPAQFTSQELAGLVQTEVFMASVLDTASVELSADPILKVGEVAELRSSILSYASSQNLVAVVVATEDPDLSFRLTSAIIDEFVQFQISVDVAESGASEIFFNDLTETYRLDLVEARRDVNNALSGVDDIADLTPRRQLEIERLRAAEALAEDRFRASAEEIEVSKLAMLQTETDVRQSYSTFDPPQVSNQPDEDLFNVISVLFLSIVIGLLLALIWPIIIGFTGRMVLFPEDLESASVSVLAEVPKISRRSLRPRPQTGEEQQSDGDPSDIERQATETILFAPGELTGAKVQSTANEDRAMEQTEPENTPKESAATEDAPERPSADLAVAVQPEPVEAEDPVTVDDANFEHEDIQGVPDSEPGEADGYEAVAVDDEDEDDDPGHSESDETGDISGTAPDLSESNRTAEDNDGATTNGVGTSGAESPDVAANGDGPAPESVNAYPMNPEEAFMVMDLNDLADESELADHEDS